MKSKEFYEYHIKCQHSKEQPILATWHTFKNIPGMNECLVLYNRHNDPIGTLKADDLLYFTRTERFPDPGKTPDTEGQGFADQGRLYKSEEHAREEKEFSEETNKIVEDKMEDLKKTTEPYEYPGSKDKVDVQFGYSEENTAEEEKENNQRLAQKKRSPLAHEQYEKLEKWHHELRPHKSITKAILRKQREKEEKSERWR